MGVNYFESTQVLSTEYFCKKYLSTKYIFKMYLSTKYTSTQNLLKYILKYFFEYINI